MPWKAIVYLFVAGQFCSKQLGVVGKKSGVTGICYEGSHFVRPASAFASPVATGADVAAHRAIQMNQFKRDDVTG